jgi:hypothetical protein
MKAIFALLSVFITFSSASASLVDQAIVRSKHAWEYLQSTRYEYTDLYVNGRIVIRGLPGRENNVQVRTLSSQEIANTVFRHYTSSGKVGSIGEANYLVTGPVAYVNSPYIYTDLTGVFLTLPNCKQTDVGLDSTIHAAAIDLKIDSRITVLRIEPCIFLVPGPAAMPEWMRAKVQSSTHAGDPYYAEQLKRNKIGYDALIVPFVKKSL